MAGQATELSVPRRGPSTAMLGVLLLATARRMWQLPTLPPASGTTKL